MYLRRLVATEGSDVDATAAQAARRAAGRLPQHTPTGPTAAHRSRRWPLAAVELGHEYLVLTDHSPRLKVARGLTADRLRRQLDHVAAVNEALPQGLPHAHRDRGGHPRRRLAGPGRELLARLDVVVGSVHSGLSDDAGEDDPANADSGRQPAPGHPRPLHRPDGGSRPAGVTGPGDRGTGRVPGRRATSTRTRSSPPARSHDKAVEINSRPERQDPPKRLIRRALEAGCRFAIDTDAHAPGQLDWQRFGCERAALLRRAGRPGGQHLDGAPAEVDG